MLKTRVSNRIRSYLSVFIVTIEKGRKVTKIQITILMKIKTLQEHLFL